MNISTFVYDPSITIISQLILFFCSGAKCDPCFVFSILFSLISRGMGSIDLQSGHDEEEKKEEEEEEEEEVKEEGEEEMEDSRRHK